MITKQPETASSNEQAANVDSSQHDVRNGSPQRMARRPVVITESVFGNWCYHLSSPDAIHIGLCGANTMISPCPITLWGFVGQLRESYCHECEELAKTPTDPELRDGGRE